MQFNYSKEIYHVQRELLRERTRCRALEEELENPMNVHRWRKLEGIDPDALESVEVNIYEFKEIGVST